MERKPIAVISTDWHLTANNAENRKELISQQIDLARKLGVDVHFCLGDVFQSRQAQPLAALVGLGEIFDKFDHAGHKIIMIPGNHDKTEYSSVDNFLMPFRNHKSLLLCDDEVRKFELEGVWFLAMPFFEQEVWLENFKHAPPADVLLSHIAVEGSVNNDGSTVSSPIKTELFKRFKKVFLGHYHNQQKVGENIYHLPSIAPKDFGEDNNKGFTVLYDDLTTELVVAKFKNYITVKVNLDEVDAKTLTGLKKKYANSEDNIRFKILGSEEKIKSIQKDDFLSVGIDIKTELTEQEFTEAELLEVQQFNSSSIVEEFKNWCEKEQKDFETGLKYLNKKLNGIK